MPALTLHVTNAGLRFSAGLQLPWSATNLPPGSFLFRQREPVYWEMEMTEYDASNGQLALRVTDFEADPGSYDPDRQPKRPVRSIRLEPLPRTAFCAQLSYYSAEVMPFTVEDREIAPRTGQESGHKSEDTAPASPPRTVTFTVPWAEVEIIAGGVRGHHELDPFGPLPFTVRNPHLLPEFNLIRGFFPKALRRKTLAVTAELHFPDGEPALRAAASPQVTRIDDRMLQQFRSRALRRLTGPVTEPDPGLFSPGEFLASLDDDDPGKVLLPPAGQDLLLALLDDREVRNAAQLRYLATERQARGQPLRYVLSPRFGFVFLAVGEEMHHFILELPDSHATYVWSLPRTGAPLADHYRAVETEIRRLNEIGRAAYRRLGTDGPDFRVIPHDHAGSRLIDGFPRWRARLEEGLW